MTDNSSRALLPAGLRDILPPFAEREAEVVTRLMGDFATHGFERVKPPLIEFEDSLLSGSGAAVAKHTFRVMDPVSQRMMGVRVDMTPQVARIATTRLIHAPRPLRLSYAGQVLRVRGSQLRPERQFGQAGIELIGIDSATADAEVIALAALSVRALGIDSLSVDLTLPTLVATIVEELGDRGSDLEDAVAHKDMAAAMAAKGTSARILARLIEAVGPADAALARLAGIDLPPRASALRERLAQVVALVRAAAPNVTLTVDPVETRGFEYHSGLAFALFSRALQGELGRGGRYVADGEPSTGATLFMDTLIASLPDPAPARRLYVPLGCAAETARHMRELGWVTVAGLVTVADPAAEARRLDCSHVLADGVAVPARP